MANEVHELVVQMRPDGIDETESELQGAEGQFEDTADAVGDSAAEMEGFAARWRGAMNAIMVAFAVAATGLLSQVPVVGELMSSIVAVLEALAFQIDGVLRPVLGPLADAFFRLSAEIFKLDGAAGTIVGVLATLAAIFAVVWAAS